jgi:hypothetical protein
VDGTANTVAFGDGTRPIVMPVVNDVMVILLLSHRFPNLRGWAQDFRSFWRPRALWPD